MCTQTKARRVKPAADYLLFFSRFACLFSLAVLCGRFFVSFRMSLDFDIRSVSRGRSIKNRTQYQERLINHIFRQNARAMPDKIVLSGTLTKLLCRVLVILSGAKNLVPGA
jgi:hypothetical protein